MMCGTADLTGAEKTSAKDTHIPQVGVLRSIFRSQAGGWRMEETRRHKTDK